MPNARSRPRLDNGIRFSIFFRRRQQRYALGGERGGPETDYCYGVLRPSEFTDITSLSRSDSVFPNINLFITPSVNKLLRLRTRGWSQF